VAAFLALLGVAVGLALGIWAGFAVGKRISERPEWNFWVANGVALLLGLLLNIVGLMFGQLPVAMVGLGFIGGGITGLKYGYGKLVKALSTVDRLADTAALMGRQTGAPRDIHGRANLQDGRVGRDPLGRDSDVVDPTVGLGRPRKRRP
jgi:hypothetical protein